MDRDFFKGVLVGCCLAFIASTILIWHLFKTQDPTKLSSDATVEDKLGVIQNYIDKYYIGDVEHDTLYDGAFEGFVNALGDKYSAYYNPDDAQRLDESNSGEFFGIGVYVVVLEGEHYPYVTGTIEGGGAQDAGILADDRIIEVDGQDVYDMPLESVVALIKGDEGTTVNVGVKREGEEDLIYFDVERRKVQADTVFYDMLEEKVGDIYISSFDGVTTEQFNNAVQDLLDRGMEYLIIDLRDNGGGLVNTAVDICDRILPSDQLVVYTEDKDGNRQDFKTDDDEEIDIPIVILINGNTASASEIFTGCLRDYDKAVAIGTTSFGKGIVQTLFKLSDGSELKLTTSYYYSPDGTNIHGIGITPDVEVESVPDNDRDEQIDAAYEYFGLELPSSAYYETPPEGFEVESATE